jgi:hypothetical protein
MTTTIDLDRARRQIGRPPAAADRAWRTTLPLAPGRQPSEQVPDPDAIAAALAPAGWDPAGAIICSRPNATLAPEWRGWYLRLTYWPEAWRERTTLRAPVAVYAAAQIAGLHTALDGCLEAGYGYVQYRTPDGTPLARHHGTWDGAAVLPAEVRQAIARIESVDRLRAIGGHRRGRPDTPHARATAMALDEADTRTREQARAIIEAWVREHYPNILTR